MPKEQVSPYETRFALPVELREEDDGKTVKVVGYAAVFDQRAEIGEWFIEIFKRGAFAESLKEDDVVFLLDHQGLPLARTRSGTLKLSEDSHGLKVESELDMSDPDTQRLQAKMKRGDMDKMSIAFRALKQEWDDEAEPPVRTISKAQLFDVSAVTFPAYEGTEIALRSLDKARKTRNFNAVQRRLRMKMNLDLRRKSVEA